MRWHHHPRAPHIWKKAMLPRSVAQKKKHRDSGPDTQKIMGESGRAIAFVTRETRHSLAYARAYCTLYPRWAMIFHWLSLQHHPHQMVGGWGYAEMKGPENQNVAINNFRMPSLGSVSFVRQTEKSIGSARVLASPEFSRVHDERQVSSTSASPRTESDRGG